MEPWGTRGRKGRVPLAGKFAGTRGCLAIAGGRAITFFELMVVIALTAILAILAIVSTSTLISRTKYSRVKEDHRVLARALQNYQMDYAALPPAEAGLRVLERPTAYVGTVPEDPFRSASERSRYVYLRPKEPGISFLLISTGPDGDYDLPDELRALAGLPSLGAAVATGGEAMLASGNGGGDVAPRITGVLPVGIDPASLTEDPAHKAAREKEAADAATRHRRELLQAYLSQKNWQPGAADPDGDVITVVRY